jgi:RHS repeat-associated protein
VVIDEDSDAAGRLERTTTKNGSTVLQDFTYGYRDASARGTALRVRFTDLTASRSTRYAYDELDRLRRARTESSASGALHIAAPCSGTGAVQGLACWDLELDRTGNRQKLTVTGSTVTNQTTTYVTNSANQLKTRTTGSSTASYDYDANGNETTGPGRSYSYNERDQQTSVNITGLGAYGVSFLGAGQAERYDANGIKLQFNALGLGVRDNGPSDVSFFTRTKTGRLLSHRYASGRNYYLTDALGSVTGLVDSSGTLVRSLRYDPSGNVQSATGTATNLQAFAGGYKLAGELLHFGQRYYDPTTGRWTQVDPLDQTGDLKEGNRYLYAAGDPVTATDPTGQHADYPVHIGSPVSCRHNSYDWCYRRSNAVTRFASGCAGFVAGGQATRLGGQRARASLLCFQSVAGWR